MKNPELPACKAAIAQALRYEFRMTPKEIAPLAGCTPRYVTQVTSRETTTIQWKDREHQAVAIEEARKLISSPLVMVEIP